MNENGIRNGDYVKDRVTGRTGEVLETLGKSCLVELRDPETDEVSEKKIAISRLERLDMPELDSATVQAVVRGETFVRTLTYGVDCMLDMKSDAVYMADPTDLLADVPDFTPQEIKEVRLASQMSQRTFAACVGVSAKSVEAWEGGISRPDGAARRILGMMKTNPSFAEDMGLITSA